LTVCWSTPTPGPTDSALHPGAGLESRRRQNHGPDPRPRWAQLQLAPARVSPRSTKKIFRRMTHPSRVDAVYGEIFPFPGRSSPQSPHPDPSRKDPFPPAAGSYLPPRRPNKFFHAGHCGDFRRGRRLRVDGRNFGAASRITRAWFWVGVPGPVKCHRHIKQQYAKTGAPRR